MTIVGSVVIFCITWMVVLFTVLPWGVRSHLEEGAKIEPGTVESAPVRPQILKKFAITTLITAILFTLFWATVEFELFDFRGFFES